MGKRNARELTTKMQYKRSAKKSKIIKEVLTDDLPTYRKRHQINYSDDVESDLDDYLSEPEESDSDKASNRAPIQVEQVDVAAPPVPVLERQTTGPTERVQYQRLIERLRRSRAALDPHKIDKVELKTLAAEYDRLTYEIENSKPTLVKILKAKVPNNTKCRAIELLDQWDRDSGDSIDLKDRINELIATGLNDKASDKLSDEEAKIQSINSSKKCLKERILLSAHPIEIKALIYDRYKRYDAMTGAEQEQEKGKLGEWIDYALQIPHRAKPLLSLGGGQKKDLSSFLVNVRRQLDQHVWGMDAVKEEILMIVNNMICNPNAGNKHLALIGDPGVGKTEIMRALSHVLSLPFEQISMGGIKDSSFLHGHNYAYVGASPGIIVKSMCKMGYKNGIVFFDEIDKIAQTAQGNEVSSNLLHLLDPTQNKEFRDKYLEEFPIDVSNIWFVYSLNNEDGLDKVLRDRMHIVRVPGYTRADKIEISKRFLIPKAIVNAGFASDDLRFTNDTIGAIVDAVERPEQGVRQLSRNIQNLVRRLSLWSSAGAKGKSGGIHESLRLGYSVNNFKLPYTVDRQVVLRLCRDSLY
jgi:ATP-dependent Lon protease